MLNRPNILWIQTCGQRTDSLSCYGSRWARTPNLQTLASRGTVFLNAYCNSLNSDKSHRSQMPGLPAPLR